MKPSRSEVRRKTHAIPTLRFEDQQLTSLAGLVVFQQLFDVLSLKHHLRGCFAHLKCSPIFDHARLIMLLVVHCLLGFRELRHVRHYQNDPLVQRLLGLTKLPDVATISRQLSGMDSTSVEHLMNFVQKLVTDRLKRLKLARVTLDFDGSVIGTNRCAEGTAVGFNKKKKGQRSYYPCFCTIPQTGQVFSVMHRSGNVYDSNGARDFIVRSVEQLRASLPGVIVEVRMDSAFFSDEIVKTLDEQQIEYTISVPFERFARLKSEIDKRCAWDRIDEACDCFERQWKPKSWKRRHRFLFVRQESKLQKKGPVQLDLFTPYQYGYEFKVIVTNKTLSAGAVVEYHNARGTQEQLFAELKSESALGYVPTRTWRGNKTWMLCVMLAHNLTRELQMLLKPRSRTTLRNRPALWVFEKLDTLRRRLVQRAGRLIRPQGNLTLSMSADETLQKEMMDALETLQTAT